MPEITTRRAGRPKKEAAKKRYHISVYVSAATIDNINYQAEERGESVSATAARVLDRAFKEDNYEQYYEHMDGRRDGHADTN